MKQKEKCSGYDYSLVESARQALRKPNRYICCCVHCRAQAESTVMIRHNIECCFRPLQLIAKGPDPDEVKDEAAIQQMRREQPETVRTPGPVRITPGKDEREWIVDKQVGPNTWLTVATFIRKPDAELYQFAVRMEDLLDRMEQKARERFGRMGS